MLSAAMASAATALPIGTRISSAATQFDLASAFPDGNFHVENARRYVQEVAKATNGEVTIQIQSGGALGFKGPEMLGAIRDGLVPMGDSTPVLQIGEEPLMGIESIPFLHSNNEELRTLHKYARPEFDKIAAKHNQKILYMVPWPDQYVHAKLDASTLEEMRGLRLRVSDSNGEVLFNRLGLAAVLMPWGDTVAALASGRIGGVATSAASAVDGKFWEFLTHVYLTRHLRFSQMISINLDSWNSLTEQQQNAMVETAERLEPEFWEASITNDQENLKVLSDGGMKIVDLSDETMKEFRERTRPMLDEFIQRVPESEPILRQYLKDVGRA